MDEHWVAAEADRGTAAALLLEVSPMRCSCGRQGSELTAKTVQEGETIHYRCPECQGRLEADVSEWEE